MNSPHFDDNLPPDLLPIAEALDRLGAAERASAPMGMEARIEGASLDARLNASMAQLTEADRLAAPPGLEDSVFQASRRELPAGAGTIRVLFGRSPMLWRAAAAVAVVGLSVGAYVMSLPGPIPPNLARNDVITQADVDSVLAMMASIDSSTMHDQVESLAREADGLSPAGLSEPPRLLEGGEGAM